MNKIQKVEEFEIGQYFYYFNKLYYLDDFTADSSAILMNCGLIENERSVMEIKKVSIKDLRKYGESVRLHDTIITQYYAMYSYNESGIHEVICTNDIKKALHALLDYVPQVDTCDLLLTQEDSETKKCFDLILLRYRDDFNKSRGWWRTTPWKFDYNSGILYIHPYSNYKFLIEPFMNSILKDKSDAV